MKRQIFVLFICATILFVKGAQKQKCKKTDINSLKDELIEAIGNLTEKLTKEINHNEEKLTAQKEELIESFDSKLQAIKNDIKAELAKLTKEINQNEDKLNALKTQNQGSLSTLTAQLTKTTTELSECACERRRQRSVIYYAGHYIYTFAAAKAYCKSKGHKIATPAQLDAAFALGMQTCAWGWVKDGSTRYPHQMPLTNTWCGHRGVNIHSDKNPSNKFGVYCATNPGPD